MRRAFLNSVRKNFYERRENSQIPAYNLRCYKKSSMGWQLLDGGGGGRHVRPLAKATVIYIP